MSASVMLRSDNEKTAAKERPTNAPTEFERVASESPRFDDELWPWVQLPDGRLELVADAA
jgi:hypothetical protein